jgi:hypothetical protein
MEKIMNKEKDVVETTPVNQQEAALRRNEEAEQKRLHDKEEALRHAEETKQKSLHDTAAAKEEALRRDEEAKQKRLHDAELAKLAAKNQPATQGIGATILNAFRIESEQAHQNRVQQKAELERSTTQAKEDALRRDEAGKQERLENEAKEKARLKQ